MFRYVSAIFIVVLLSFQALAQENEENLSAVGVGKVSHPVTETKHKINLTLEQQQWLKLHPVIRVHNEKNWPPFNFNVDGKATGFSIQYMNLLAQKAGFSIQYISGEWDELLTMAFNKQIDVMLNIVKNEERQKHLLYTPSYVKNPNVIVAKKESNFTGMDSLKGKTVSYPQGFFYDAILKAEFPEVQRYPVKDTMASLKAIQFGQADAVLGELAVIKYLIEENMLSGLELKGDFGSSNPEVENLNIAVRNDWPIFLEILNKAMQSIDAEEIANLKSKWLGKGQGNIKISQHESVWLNENESIRVVVDPDWMPLERLDPETKQHEGMIADYLKLIAKRSGISFELVATNTWQESVDLVKQKQVDFFSGVKKSTERSVYLNFSKPYISMNDVVVMRTDAKKIERMQDLNGKRVGVVKDYWIEDILRSYYPSYQLESSNNTLEGLQKVSRNELDAFVDDRMVVSYLIAKHGLYDLELAKKTSFQSKLHIGLHKAVAPEALSLINKAIDSISLEEHKQILASWVGSSIKESMPESEEQKETVNTPWLIGLSIAVFTFLMLVSLFLPRFFSEENVAKFFGTARFRVIALFLISLIVALIVVAVWLTLEQNKKETLNTIRSELEIVVKSTHESLDNWIQQNKNFLMQLGRDPELVSITKKLLDIPANDKESLIHSGALAAAREFFAKREDTFGNTGFFIISPERVSIGSARDANLAAHNFIDIQETALLDQAFDGEAVFIPPITSDVSLKGSSKKADHESLSMFFAIPIRDKNDRVLAVMTQRLSPGGYLSKIMQHGRIGNTGENYLFSQNGRMLTDSRFEEDLYRNGLLDKNNPTPYHNLIELRDPGAKWQPGLKTKSEVSLLPFTQLVDALLKRSKRSFSEAQQPEHSELLVNVNGYRDYRGIAVMGAGLWDYHLGMGVITEIDVEEALQGYTALKRNIIIITAFTLLLSISAALLTIILGERATAAMRRSRDELEDKIQEKTKNLQLSEQKTRLLLASVGEGVFGVGVDGLVNFINPAALEILQYVESEMIGQKIHPLIHHTRANGCDYPVEDCPMFHALSEGKYSHIEDEVLWRKDGSSFPVEYKARPVLRDNQISGSVVTFSDITERVQAKEQLISEMADRKQSELMAEHAKERLENITNSIPGVVYQLQVSDGDIIVKFISYGIKQLQNIDPEQLLGNFELFVKSIYPADQEDFLANLHDSIKNLTHLDCEYRVLDSHGQIKWIHMESTATELSNGENDVIFFEHEEELEDIVINGNLVDISSARNAHDLVLKQQLEIQEIHKQTRESIEYAALIQGAIVPDNKVFRKYFQDFFAIWHPKDVVGGDIYLVEEINQDEMIVMVIDCTGHGVPGAFVTMLVKAVERQLTANLHKDKNISPAKMLSIFNKSIKQLLQQDDVDSISNAGFDGGILYYNKKAKFCRFAGANIPLFIIQNGQLSIIKGNRHSIGYKKSDANYEFTEHRIDASTPTQIYLSSDGYLDQNGGSKGFPFGKKRFSQLIQENAHESFADQQELLLYELQFYQKDHERNDDVTVVGLKLG